MAERLTPRKLDLEVRVSSLARRVDSLVKELYSTLSLFTHVYKWVPATHCWGLTLDQYPVQGEVAILLSMLHATETGISSDRSGFWLVCAFTLPTCYQVLKYSQRLFPKGSFLVVLGIY